MIKNQIHEISKKELPQLREALSHDDDLYLGEIDGGNIQSWEQYRDTISLVFHFPNKWVVNIPGYEDWIRDLDWLEKERYALIIDNYPEFLQGDLAMREIIMSGFRDLILPFWEEEVERVVVEGKAKSFQVYLVSDE